MNINVAGQIIESLSNGPGMRYVIFFQGCDHHCDGCHNPHTWEKGIGQSFSIDRIINSMLISPFVKGVTISGGEPFLQVLGLRELVENILNKTTLNILIYTGYTLEELRKRQDENIDFILNNIDYLIDGKYQKNNPTTRLYIGSDNQRIYDMKNKKEIKF